MPPSIHAWASPLCVFPLEFEPLFFSRFGAITRLQTASAAHILIAMPEDGGCFMPFALSSFQSRKTVSGFDGGKSLISKVAIWALIIKCGISFFFFCIFLLIEMQNFISVQLVALLFETSSPGLSISLTLADFKFEWRFERSMSSSSGRYNN